MKVTLKSLWATPERVVQPGDTVDVPGDVGKALVEGRFAVPADNDPKTRQQEAEPAKRTRRKTSE